MLLAGLPCWHCTNERKLKGVCSKWRARLDWGERVPRAHRTLRAPHAQVHYGSNHAPAHVAGREPRAASRGPAGPDAREIQAVRDDAEPK
jgi:hypothetical protein